MTMKIRFSANSARFTKGTLIQSLSPGAASDKVANQARSLAFARKQPQPKRVSDATLERRDEEAVRAVAVWPGANRASLSLEIS